MKIIYNNLYPIFMKTKPIQLGIILLLLFSSVALPAQDLFSPAKITLQTGEVIEGKIKYFVRTYTLRSIDFIADGSVVPKTYSPLQVKYVEMESERFVGAVVEAEQSSRDVNNLSSHNKFEIGLDTVFLSVLIDGAYPLYMQKEAQEVYNFYIQGEEGPKLLKYKKYKAIKAGRTIFRERTNYIGQLVQYTQGCKDFQKQLEALAYKQQELMRFFKAYYNCLDIEPTYVFERKALPKLDQKSGRDLFPMRVGLKVGRRETSISSEYVTNFARNFRNSRFDPSIDPVFGGFVEVFLIPWIDRMSIHTEFLYGTYQFAAQETTDIQFRDILASYRTFELNPLLRYRLVKDPFDLYLNAGISFNMDMVVEDRDIVTQRSSGIVTERSIPLFRPEFRGQIAILGAGIGYKGFNIEGRFLPVFQSTRRYSVLVSYDLLRFKL